MAKMKKRKIVWSQPWSSMETKLPEDAIVSFEGEDEAIDVGINKNGKIITEQVVPENEFKS